MQASDADDRGRRQEPDVVQADPDGRRAGEPDFARGQREGEVQRGKADLGDGPDGSEPDAASPERPDFARGQRDEERDRS